MFTQTTTSPSTGFKRHTNELAADPFQARFGHFLPSGLKEEAHGMSWRTFTETYAPTSAIRIHNMFAAPLPGHTFNYFTNITTFRGGRRITLGRDIQATGAISACTNILAEMGFPLEIVNFHQMDIFEATVTFIQATHRGRTVWAMGFGPDRDNSGAAAMSSAAHRIHGHKINNSQHIR